MQRGSGAVRTPEGHWAYPGSSRAPQPKPDRFRTHARAQPAYRFSRTAPCPAWVSLHGHGGGGGRESRTPRPAHRRPSAFEAGGLTTCPGPPGCGPDQVRTGGLRLDGATGTPLPYEAVTGTPPGGRTLTT